MTDSPENTDQIQAGRFKPGQSGNPAGKPKGARHKATIAAQALLDGEAESITRRAIELALAGDVTALRLVLERIVPPRKESPIIFELPEIKDNKDIIPVAVTVLAGVIQGKLTLSEGQALGVIVEQWRKAVETIELEQRISKLEKDLKK